MRAPTQLARWRVRLIRLLTRGLGVRFLVALALSALVWGGLTLEQNPNALELFADNIPVDHVNLGPNLVLASSIQPVRVSVAGPKVNLARLSLRDFVARVDLTDLGAGTQQVRALVQISDPAVEVDRVTPETVSVRLDPLITARLPVAVRVDSAPVTGFRAEISDAVSTPAEVRVSGAASAVERVAAVHATVSLEGATRDVSAQTLLVPIDRQGEEVTSVRVDPQTAQISVPVTRVTSRKRVPVVPQLDGEVAADFFLSRISVVPTTVEIEGQPEDLERVDSVQTQPVDLSGARSDVQRDVGFIRPAGVLIVSDQPLASVTIVVEPLEDSTTIQAAVVIVNLGTGLQAVAEPAALQLVIAGSANILRELSGGDIVAEVDVRNRAPGLHQIRPVINVPPGVGVELVIPPIVEVRIEAAAPGRAATPAVIIGPGGAVPTPTPSPTPTPRPTPTPTGDGPPRLPVDG